jgi:hypothetical protein
MVSQDEFPDSLSPRLSKTIDDESANQSGHLPRQHMQSERRYPKACYDFLLLYKTDRLMSN